MKDFGKVEGPGGGTPYISNINRGADNVKASETGSTQGASGPSIFNKTDRTQPGAVGTEVTLTGGARPCDYLSDILKDVGLDAKFANVVSSPYAKATPLTAQCISEADYLTTGVNSDKILDEDLTTVGLETSMTRTSSQNDYLKESLKNSGLEAQFANVTPSPYPSGGYPQISAGSISEADYRSTGINSDKVLEGKQSVLSEE